MENQKYLKDIEAAIVALDQTKVEALVAEALEKGVAAIEIIKHSIAEGLYSIGDKFEKGEYYMPELMEGGIIAKKVIEILKPHLPVGEGGGKGKIVFGAVKGDLHDIGMNLVITQLEAAGYEVISLGVDISGMDFIENAKKSGADIIAMTALLTTTMPYFSEVINYLTDMGLRDKYFVIVGGGTTDEAYAKLVGADGTAQDAVQCVKLCDRLMAQKRSQ